MIGITKHMESLTIITNLVNGHNLSYYISGKKVNCTNLLHCIFNFNSLAITFPQSKYCCKDLPGSSLPTQHDSTHGSFRC